MTVETWPATYFHWRPHYRLWQWQRFLFPVLIPSLWLFHWVVLSSVRKHNFPRRYFDEQCESTFS
jgi:hypothetical protein